MINLLVVSGNVGAKPQVKVFETGKKLVRFAIAVNQFSKTQEQPEPLWLDIEAWDNVADRLLKCEVDKGRKITVTGMLAPNVYQTQMGDHSATVRKVKVKLANFEVASRNVQDVEYNLDERDENINWHEKAELPAKSAEVKPFGPARRAKLLST